MEQDVAQNFAQDRQFGLALLAIGAFVIDRLAIQVLALLRMTAIGSRLLPDPARVEGARKPTAEKQQKMAYLLVVAVLAMLSTLAAPRIPLLAESLPILKQQLVGDFSGMLLNFLLVSLTLLGGADAVGAVLKFVEGGSTAAMKTEPPKLQVEGNIDLNQIVSEAIKPLLAGAAPAKGKPQKEH